METNVVCWFEIYVSDMERAKKFYSTVLAQELVDSEPIEGMDNMQMAYFPYAENAPNANGALVKMEGVREVGVAATSTIVYFACADCSVEQSRVETAGGTVHLTKTPIGDHGFCSICIDTEGNTFGLHSMN